jgi:SPP1 gp7 family putative phage head morphogenesis protein
MSNFKDDEVKFIEGLYDNANEQLKEVYKQQQENRNELLKQIADVMLTYTIAHNVMSLSKDEKSKLEIMFLDLITKNAKGQGAATEKLITHVLNDTVNNTFKFYSYNAGFKDIEKIINNNYKGKHFSERVWDNEREVAKFLHKQTQDFLQGKVNVNQIKKHIQDTYNDNAYEVRRLVETEVNRCEDEAFRKFCRETGVKKVIRNEVLDSKTCSKCAPLDGKPFDLDKAPGVVHPLCRGFNTIADNEISVNNGQYIKMNLQLFAKKSNYKVLKQQISNGQLDLNQAKNGMKYWKKAIKENIKTPIENIKNSRKSIDQYWHILEDHKEFLKPSEIDNIINCLKHPDEIRLSFGKYVYIKKINDKDLLTIIKGDIITSYYPTKRYLNYNIRKKELIWHK